MRVPQEVKDKLFLKSNAENLAIQVTNKQENLIYMLVKSCKLITGLIEKFHGKDKSSDLIIKDN